MVFKVDSFQSLVNLIYQSSDTVRLITALVFVTLISLRDNL